MFSQNTIADSHDKKLLLWTSAEGLKCPETLGVTESGVMMMAACLEHQIQQTVLLY